MDHKDKPLTPREQEFVAEYLKTSNATQAAITAGYSQDRDAASVRAHNLKKRPHIQAAIESAKEDIAARLQINMEWSLGHLKKVADVNSAEFTDDKGNTRQVDSKSVISAVDSVAKHLGYYAPEKQDHTINAFRVDEQVLADFEREY